MPFPKSVREEALVKAQRHCCVCHDFAGRSVNVHHIEQESEGGSNTLENAIVLCLRCHAEAGHFNSKHPLGTKYAPSELVRHRDAWFEACANGNARYASIIESMVKRTFTSQELHRYAVLFSFHNGNENVVSEWKLNVFIPWRLHTETGEVEEHMDVVIEGARYRKFQVSNSETLYLGESCELTDSEWAKIEYSIDDNIYYSAADFRPKIVWHFYSSAEPPIRGELVWEDMQQF